MSRSAIDRGALAVALEERLQFLNERIRRIDADLGTLLDADFEEQAVELEDREVLEALEGSELKEIAQLERALARLADGSYGTCTGCGEPIAEKRLAALPTATTCITCAR